MIRLVVVEEQELLSRAVVSDLVRSGIEVVGVAGDFQWALGLVEETRPDVALVDLYLRGGASGVELTRELHALRPDLGVLVYARHPWPPLAERVVQAGGWGVVSRLDDLVAAIRRAGEPFAFAEMNRVVVVEHDRMHRSAVNERLPRSDIDVVASAADFESAFAVIEQTGPDVVLVGLDWPDGSGIDLTRQLLATWPGLRVLVSAPRRRIIDAGRPGRPRPPAAPRPWDLERRVLEAGGCGFVFGHWPFDDVAQAVRVAGGSGGGPDGAGVREPRRPPPELGSDGIALEGP